MNGELMGHCVRGRDAPDEEPAGTAAVEAAVPEEVACGEAHLKVRAVAQRQRAPRIYVCVWGGGEVLKCWG